MFSEFAFIQRLQLFVIEVFECINDLDPAFMSDKFTFKYVPYNIRNNSTQLNMANGLSNTTAHIYGICYLQKLRQQNM